MTTNLESVEAILDFAIAREQEAHDLYLVVADLVTRAGLRQTFLDLAEMEMGHRRKLEGIRSGQLPGFAPGKVEDLRISDALLGVAPGPDMTYQETLMFAMKAEQRAHDLYVGLAAATSDPALREVFRSLAGEELGHKHFFETEYDDVVLADN